MPRSPLFVSHGAPSLLFEDVPARSFLRTMLSADSKPAAILVASAHWTTRELRVDSSPAPRTIHDFSGFQRELYEVQYRASGAPALASEVVAALEERGWSAQLEARGLDHGAWVPLALALPDADVPVVQVAIQPHLGAKHHYELGRALERFACDDVLVIGSGSATHDLGSLEAPGSPTPTWVREFDDWLATALERGDVDALVDYRKRAPHAAHNHPTEEHFFPLLVALGAAGPTPRTRVLHRSYTYGVLSMAAYAFDGPAARKF